MPNEPLTREHLLSRGECCGNGCTNCPYHPEARNRPVEGWATVSARECYALKRNHCDARDYAEIIARHAPDLEAIKQQARKDALLEAATRLWWGPHVPDAPTRMSSGRGRDRTYAVAELRRLANASTAETPKEKTK